MNLKDLKEHIIVFYSFIREITQIFIEHEVVLTNVNQDLHADVREAAYWALLQRRWKFVGSRRSVHYLEPNELSLARLTFPLFISK